MKDYYELRGYISNSSLNILEKSSREFKKFLFESPEEDSKSYFDFGTAFHMYVLEPERFKEEVIVLDYSIPKSVQQRDFCKAYAKLKKPTKKNKEKVFLSVYKQTPKWEEKVAQIIEENEDFIKFLQIDSNKLVISTKNMQTIKNITAELKRHKMASKLLSNDTVIDDGILRFNELQILWEYKGAKCKSMLDRVLIDTEAKKVTIVDLKTTSSILEFKKSFERYHYDRQLAFYGMAVMDKIHEITDNKLTKDDLEDFTIEGVIIAVDKNTEEVKAFKIEEEVIVEASKEVISLLEDAVWHITNRKYDYSREYYEGDGFDSL